VDGVEDFSLMSTGTSGLVVPPATSQSRLDPSTWTVLSSLLSAIRTYWPAVARTASLVGRNLGEGDT